MIENFDFEACSTRIGERLISDRDFDPSWVSGIYHYEIIEQFRNDCKSDPTKEELSKIIEILFDLFPFKTTIGAFKFDLKDHVLDLLNYD